MVLGQLDIKWALKFVFFRKWKVILFFLHTDCSEQAAEPVGFKCEPQSKMSLSWVYLQGQGLQSAATDSSCSSASSPAGRWAARILGCPLSSVSRAKHRECTRLEGTVRAPMQILVLAAGSHHRISPSCLPGSFWLSSEGNWQLQRVPNLVGLA